VAGRFDGMDFNADECRLVVLAAQPRAINPQEAFAARRRGLPPNVQAEIDLAENHTELSTPELVDCVERFLRQDFSAFDAELAEAVADLPAAQPPELDDSTAE
jgi:hypothetical protein